jgi:hypothetical protein
MSCLLPLFSRFMTDYPGELVILDFNSECGYDSDHADSGGNYPRLTADQWKPFWTQFRDGINQGCKGFGDGLSNVTMKGT